MREGGRGRERRATFGARAGGSGCADAAEWGQEACGCVAAGSLAGALPAPTPHTARGRLRHWTQRHHPIPFPPPHTVTHTYSFPPFAGAHLCQRGVPAQTQRHHRRRPATCSSSSTTSCSSSSSFSCSSSSSFSSSSAAPASHRVQVQHQIKLQELVGRRRHRLRSQGAERAVEAALTQEGAAAPDVGGGYIHDYLRGLREGKDGAELGVGVVISRVKFSQPWPVMCKET